MRPPQSKFRLQMDATHTRASSSATPAGSGISGVPLSPPSGLCACSRAFRHWPDVRILTSAWANHSSADPPPSVTGDVLCGTLRPFLDKSRQVAGTTTCHQRLVDNDFLIDPGGIGILQVGLERWPRSNRSSADDICLNQGPRAMADGRHRLPGFEKFTDKSNHLPIQNAARPGWRPPAELVQHTLPTPPPRPCERPPPFPLFRGAACLGYDRSLAHDVDNGASSFERLTRLGQFGLLEAISRNHCKPSAL
jgi:hypothetical protein